MTVPLVAVRRGDRVESLHTGSIAVCDADGRLVVEIGDIDAPIFPRSAVKAIQALPLVESGAADAFGLTDAHLSLVCASHSGEPDHVETTRDLLHKAGVGKRASSAVGTGRSTTRPCSIKRVRTRRHPARSSTIAQASIPA